MEAEEPIKRYECINCKSIINLTLDKKISGVWCCNNPKHRLILVEGKGNNVEQLLREERLKIFSRLGQAEMFIEKQPLFYDKSGLWWIWNNDLKFWNLVDEIEILNLINRDLNIDTTKSQSKTEILNALKQVGRNNTPKFEDKRLIQFKNGLVHLNEPNNILEPNSNYFITNPLNWNYGESEETPKIDHLFNQWVGEKYSKSLYEILAYCMLPDYPIHRLFCFVGSGLNGKGTYFRLMNKFLGEKNITSCELDTLLTSRFEVTRLHKKLVCQMGETNFNEMKRTSMLKKLTGGDLIGYEYKGKTPFEDYNYAKIVISTNGLPTTNDKTIGFYRRWMIIDFPTQFTEKFDILRDIPDYEFENLGRKCVRILNELLNNREFTNEGSIEERQSRYEERSNPIGKFMEMFIEEDLNCYISKSDLKRKLNAWLLENKHRGISEVTLGKIMKHKNIETIKQTLNEPLDIDGKKIDRIWVYGGIKWKN